MRRTLELKRLPDVATISRMLKETDQRSVDKLQKLVSELVLERLASLAPRRITLDFDGSVQSTKRQTAFDNSANNCPR